MNISTLLKCVSQTPQRLLVTVVLILNLGDNSFAHGVIHFDDAAITKHGLRAAFQHRLRCSLDQKRVLSRSLALQNTCHHLNVKLYECIYTWVCVLLFISVMLLVRGRE